MSARRAYLASPSSALFGIAVLFILDGATAWDRNAGARETFVLVAAGIIIVVTALAMIPVARRFIERVEVSPARIAGDTNAALLEASLAQISQGLCIIDLQHRLAIVNRRFAEMFGIPAHWLRTGVKFSEAAALIGISLEGDTDLQRFWRDEMDGDQPQTIQQAMADGRMIEIDSHRLPDGGHVIMFSDVSGRERTSEELRDTKVRADTALQVKSEFLANMSRELRTPLNAIIGFTDVMAAEMFGPLGHPNYREYIEDIQGLRPPSVADHHRDAADGEDRRRADRAARTGRRSRRRRGVLPPHDARARRGRQCAADLEFPPDLPLLCADERLVRQILLNLLANAVKFTPRGGHLFVSGTLDESSSAHPRC